MFLRLFAFVCLLLASAPTFASADVCPSESQRAELSAFRDRLAGAATVDDARDMAFEQTRMGHTAIERASRVLPRNQELAVAQAQLDVFDARLAAATTPAEVAAAVDQLSDSRAGMNCDYTNTEIVIIVIGFILGILPGILFLFLFC